MHGTGRHLAVGHEAVVLDGIKHITEGTALREGHVAVGADGGFGAVEVGLVDDEHLREVVLGLAHAEQFGLKESQRAVAPAGAGLVLVFDGGDGKFLDGGKLEAFLFFGFVFFSLRLCNDADAEHQGGGG